MIIEVTVKTGSKKGPLLEPLSTSTTGNYDLENLPPNSNAPVIHPQSYTAYLREKPHDNAANKALLNLLSKSFHTPKTTIKILSGHKSHHKKIEISN